MVVKDCGCNKQRQKERLNGVMLNNIEKVKRNISRYQQCDAMNQRKFAFNCINIFTIIILTIRANFFLMMSVLKLSKLLCVI